MKLHKGLFFRDQDKEVDTLKKDIGNVDSSTEVIFEYGIKPEFAKSLAEQEPKAGKFPEIQDTRHTLAILRNSSFLRDHKRCFTGKWRRR